ncbi:MAG: hypothetical protein M0Q44_19050, partial [Methylobacter sp.]|nr:hypothetical protein [Methylobacter sp.]
ATDKIRKDIFLYKVGLPTTTGLVQQPVQIVARYRSHNLTLFVMSSLALTIPCGLVIDAIWRLFQAATA